MGKTQYILVADGASAKIYKSSIPLDTLTLISEQDNAEGRMATSERYSDRAGVGHSSGEGVHSYAGEKHSHDDEVFAKKLCHWLKAEHNAGHYQGLMLVAPPHFLGELRQHLSKDCEQAVVGSLNKDLVRLSEQELITHLG